MKNSLGLINFRVSLLQLRLHDNNEIKLEINLQKDGLKSYASKSLKKRDASPVVKKNIIQEKIKDVEIQDMSLLLQMSRAELIQQ